MTHGPRPHPQPGDALPPELARLRDALVTPPPEDVAVRHLAAIATAAQEATHLAPTREPAASTWGLRVRRVLGLTGAKVALTASAALAATGGLAVTGTLPEPAQRVVSEAAERVGIDLPSPGDAAAEGSDGTPAGEGDGTQRDGTDTPVDGDGPAPDGVSEPGSENAEDDTPPADGDLPEDAEPGTEEADPRVPDGTPPSDAPAGTTPGDGPATGPETGSDDAAERDTSDAQNAPPADDQAPSADEQPRDDEDPSGDEEPPSEGERAEGTPTEFDVAQFRTGGS